MRSNAGMVNREGDVDLREAQVSAPQLALYLGLELSHSSYPSTYEDGTECSETSAYKIQTLGNYPEERIQHSEHGKSLNLRIQVRLSRVVFHFSRCSNNLISTISVHQTCKCYKLLYFKFIFPREKLH
jgi:hypothetical protein